MASVTELLEVLRRPSETGKTNFLNMTVIDVVKSYGNNKDGVAILKYVFEKEDGDARMTCEEGMGALHHCILRTKPLLMCVLIKHCAPIDQRDAKRNTPLHMACAYGQNECCQILLRAKSNVHAKNNEDMSPLTLACSHSSLDCVNMILDACAAGGEPYDINVAEGDVQVTPLSATSCPEITARLLELQADINFKAADRCISPLYAAVSLQQHDKVDVLLHANAPINSITKEGLTPLHAAAGCGDSSLVKLLLCHRADVHMGNAERGVFHEAATNGYTEIAAELFRARARRCPNESKCRKCKAMMHSTAFQKLMSDEDLMRIPFEMRKTEQQHRLQMAREKAFREEEARDLETSSFDDSAEVPDVLVEIAKLRSEGFVAFSKKGS